MNKIFSFANAYRIPILGYFIKYLNAYAYKGNAKYLKEIAPFANWKTRVAPPLITSVILSLIIAWWVGYTNLEGFDPGEYVLGAVPDLLGFAIGVFALIFVLPSSFLSTLIKSKLSFKPIEIPINVAYPLIMLVYGLFFSFILQLFNNDSFVVRFLETFIFIYSFEMILELVRFIYLMSRVSLDKQSRLLASEHEKELRTDVEVNVDKAKDNEK
jgi:hypothetical protein